MNKISTSLGKSPAHGFVIFFERLSFIYILDEVCLDSPATGQT